MHHVKHMLINMGYDMEHYCQLLERLDTTYDSQVVSWLAANSLRK